MAENERKPEDISDDIWATAENTVLAGTDSMDHDISVAIARAIYHERQRVYHITARWGRGQGDGISFRELLSCIRDPGGTPTK